MQKIRFLVLLFGACTSGYGQSARNETDVYTAKIITFYGYDLSHFRVADAKRFGQDLKTYLFKHIGSLNEKVSEEKLKKWLQKDSIRFDFDHTTTLNKQIDQNDIVVTISKEIPQDSIQAFISRYKLPNGRGIGHVIIFEGFDDLNGTLSGYSVFFDMETKRVLVNNWGRLTNLGSVNNFGTLKGPIYELVEYLDTEVYQHKAKGKKQ